MNVKKWLLAFLCFCLLLVSIPATLTVQAAAGPSVTTTLTDNVVQRGSKKTFDVWARNASGNKIKATVKLNGQKLDPTWDDNEKASYTLAFTREGENIVTVSASSDGGRKKELTYHITYQKASEGEQIGTAIWSVETFTLGCGYLIAPVEVPIYEGETAAEQLIRLLHANGFVGYYGGSVKSAFYLAYIADGTATGAKYNSYQKSGTPDVPRRLSLAPSIPAMLVPHLEETMTFFDPNDYATNWNGYLGEFAITNGSGWMYCVNNVFPNVGFADCYPADGDVIRVQFTLGYGADIGGFGAMGTEIPDVDNQPTGGYFAVANKDALTRSVCRAISSGFLSRVNVAEAYRAALNVMAALDASQSTVDAAAAALNRAVAAPDAESVDDVPTAAPTTPTRASTVAPPSPTRASIVNPTAPTHTRGHGTAASSRVTGRDAATRGTGYDAPGELSGAGGDETDERFDERADGETLWSEEGTADGVANDESGETDGESVTADGSADGTEANDATARGNRKTTGSAHREGASGTAETPASGFPVVAAVIPAVVVAAVVATVIVRRQRRRRAAENGEEERTDE